MGNGTLVLGKKLRFIVVGAVFYLVDQVNFVSYIVQIFCIYSDFFCLLIATVTDKCILKSPIGIMNLHISRFMDL